MVEEKVPVERDGGEISPEKLVSLYGDFGAKLIERKKPLIYRDDLEEKYGDLSLEIYYGRSEGLFSYSTDQEIVGLRVDERGVARDITNMLYLADLTPEELVDADSEAIKNSVPDLLADPEIKEEYREPVESIEQKPSLELVFGILRALERNPRTKARNIEDHMNNEASFNLDSTLNYLETQGAVEIDGWGRFELNDDNEVRWELDDNGKYSSLKQQQRHRNNQWKT